MRNCTRCNPMGARLMSEWRALTQAERSAADPDADRPWGSFAPNTVQRALIALGRATFLKRGVFRGTWTSLVLALGRGRLDIRFRGAAFRIRGERNLIEYGLLLNPRYNGQDIDFLLEDAGPDAQFVDLGCNIGLYSLPLAAAAPRGRVLSIDANPMMVSRIGWNAEASDLGNVVITHAAVSDKSGSADLLIRKEDVAIVTIEERAGGEMPVRRLDEIVAEVGLTAIHGLKIDIEGHEDLALVPYLDAASRDMLPGRIVIEHPEAEVDYPGCVTAFERHGYVLVGRSRNNSFYKLTR